jgi:alkaline phosphatase
MGRHSIDHHREVSVRLTLFSLLLAFAMSAGAQQQPRNIILFIGDGMGPAHVAWASQIRKDQFQIGRLPVIGVLTTAAFDRAVTDSAASATALAAGVLTKKGALSVDSEGKPVETLLELAEKKGKASGLVTTAYFWDATPAAFAAHAADRYERQHEIAKQMMGKGVELIAGGGLDRLGSDGFPSVTEFAARAGYNLIVEPTTLGEEPAEPLLAVFKSKKSDADFDAARLPQLTAWAIERLRKDPDGFLLVVEHEGTDSGSHNNDRDVVRDSLTSLDEAVGIAMQFAAGRDDTLVIVTADHETGGLRLSETLTGRPRIEWSTTDHTAAPVLFFAGGPGAATLSGFQPNHEFGRKLQELLK